MNVRFRRRLSFNNRAWNDAIRSVLCLSLADVESQQMAVSANARSNGE